MNERMTETTTQSPTLRPEPALGVKVAKTDAPFWVKLVSAGTGACLADVVTFPLDTTKVRLQVSYNVPILLLLKSVLLLFFFLHLPFIYKRYLKFFFFFFLIFGDQMNDLVSSKFCKLFICIYTRTGWRNHDKAHSTQYSAICTLCLTLPFINTSVIEPSLIHVLNDLAISTV